MLRPWTYRALAGCCLAVAVTLYAAGPFGVLWWLNVGTWLILAVGWSVLAHNAATLGRVEATLRMARRSVAAANAHKFGWCGCRQPTRLDPRSLFCSTCDRVIPTN
jgi:hypothetical protein